jgi:Methyltransferase domain
MSQEAKILYRQERLPIFQNRMYDSAEEARNCPHGDVVLVENRQTGLVYNSAFQPDLMAYDSNYQNEQALSPSFQKHLESASNIIDQYLGRNSIVEVGCGKGYFLEMLLHRGIDITGFDPAYEGNNPRIEKQYFHPGTGIKASGLILRHVLEHIQDPYGFLLLLREANAGNGKIYIEVPNFEWILEHRAWYDIFYEHVNYFRPADFERMFGKIEKSGYLFGGQYLYVVAELDTLRRPLFDENYSVVFPGDFIDFKFRGTKELAAIWGGASKGVMFALLMARAGRPVSTVIDINPAKQGKYLPSTGLRVQSPEEALAVLPRGATIYVMNSNYSEEIRKMSSDNYNYIEIDHE